MNLNWNMLTEMASPALTCLGLVWGGWWLKHFVVRTESKIDEMIKEIVKLQIKAEVSLTYRTHIEGHVSGLQTSINDTNKAVGRTEGSIKDIWRIIKSNGSTSHTAEDV